MNRETIWRIGTAIGVGVLVVLVKDLLFGDTIFGMVVAVIIAVALGFASGHVLNYIRHKQEEA